MSQDGGPNWAADAFEDGFDVPTGFDVPSQLDVLPDGSPSLVLGDVSGMSDFCHRQGDNPWGAQGTCGLVSCEQVLRSFGVEIREADVVRYAVINDLCYHEGLNRGSWGGTTVGDQARILQDFGVPAHIEVGQDIESIADIVLSDQAAIIEVNAGILWDDVQYYGYGEPNHAVVLTGVAADPISGEIVGFYINDSGTGEAGRYVDADLMRQAWQDAGGLCVVTDIIHER